MGEFVHSEMQIRAKFELQFAERNAKAVMTLSVRARFLRAKNALASSAEGLA
jgi:hypothetical protein